MRLDLLELVADHLDNVVAALPPERFDMEVWGFRETLETTATEPACGFAGCAMGHACNIPQLRALGLTMNWGPTHLAGIITYRGRCSFVAVMDLFETSYADAEYLFDSGAYSESVQPSDVSKRIRKFIADHEHFRSPPSPPSPSGERTS